MFAYKAYKHTQTTIEKTYNSSQPSSPRRPSWKFSRRPSSFYYVATSFLYLNNKPLFLRIDECP